MGLVNRKRSYPFGIIQEYGITEITEQTEKRWIGLASSIRISGGSVCFPNKILNDPVYPLRTSHLFRYFRPFPKTEVEPETDIKKKASEK